MPDLDEDDINASRIIAMWKMANDAVHKLVLNALAIPFPADAPVDSAKMALLNLKQLEWQEVCDWLAENHWLPPGN